MVVSAFVRRSVAATLILFAAAMPGSASAQVDRPISGRVLKLKRTGDATSFVFVSKDSALPFPAIGSTDDPTAGTPGGITVELFTATQGRPSAYAPAGYGDPGWTSVVRPGADAYRYRFKAWHSFVQIMRRVKFVESKELRIEATMYFSLSGPLGRAAVRVRTGSLRSCALFDEASARRDDDDQFIAMNAATPALADCSDEALAVALDAECAFAQWPACNATCPDGGVCTPEVINGPCRCVYPTQPCGTTAPLCNGECPAGEQCYSMDGAIPGPTDGCACAPIDQPPCGASGQSCSVGACPDGLVCGSLPGGGFIYEDYCGCVDPAAICGPGFGACPPDLVCSSFPGSGSYSCIPTTCADSGNYPSCGGTFPCSGGRSCVPLDFQGIHLCVCATQSFSCDAPACGGGLSCPSGEACTITGTSSDGLPDPRVGSSCGCEPY
jgi:hypothetical protein